MSLLHQGIVSTWMERMAFRDPDHCQKTSLDDSVFVKGMAGIS